MRKVFLALISLLLLSFTTVSWAEEKPAGVEAQPAVETQEQQETKAVNEYPQENYVEEISYQTMEDRLNRGECRDCVYLKQSEDSVLVFSNVAEDLSICKQIILAAPEEQMLQVYSNDKKALKKMYSASKSISREMKSSGSYNLVADKGDAVKVTKEIAIYKCWFKKFKVQGGTQTVKIQRRGLNLPIPIGIGIGLGHHHHGHINIGL